MGKLAICLSRQTNENSFYSFTVWFPPVSSNTFITFFIHFNGILLQNQLFVCALNEN